MAFVMALYRYLVINRINYTIMLDSQTLVPGSVFTNTHPDSIALFSFYSTTLKLF